MKASSWWKTNIVISSVLVVCAILTDAEASGFVAMLAASVVGMRVEQLEEER